MIKIAILGPESTGKTELAKRLAEYFCSPWVPEYAREYVEHLIQPYTYEDVCAIALRQIEEEKFWENHSTDKEFVFFDTDLIITKVWLAYRFGKIPEFLTEHMKTGFFDIYLLCQTDLPWEADSVREHGSDREFFFNWYKREIEQTGKPWVIINGIGNQRTQNAINVLKKFTPNE
jgi:NadR type nicotinamide-nucleotide adenylyltransferase